MNVTQVSILPTEAARAAGNPSLTPELLAATGARYSRSNEGLAAILSRIDPSQLDKSVDSIFRLIDYGHQSIADMAPVAMFIDDISLWLAYTVWSLCPTAGGQESSTRYIELDRRNLVPPAELGIPAELARDWQAAMELAFDSYAQALAAWEELGDTMPRSTAIPPALLDDPSEKVRKSVARMKRNYRFDRARYFLPMAATTNVMLVMSARGWASLCQYLCSHPLPEPRRLGEAIRRELGLAAPRLMRHATAKPAMQAGIRREFERIRAAAAGGLPAYLQPEASPAAMPATAAMDVLSPNGLAPRAFAEDLAAHDNRYAWIGPDLRRTAVRFGWSAMAMAEIRDLNRHRTGNKYCPLRPLGFYAALEQLPTDPSAHDQADTLGRLDAHGRDISARAHELLGDGCPAYIYWTLLGTQFAFEHVTTADKFIYEAELRTGLGAHFRYAEHLKDALRLWYARYPETRGLIIEGEAEPE